MTETNIDNIDSIIELLELYDIIQDVKEEEKKKLPYRFNVLLDANPLEPDVSRILAGFFLQKTKGEYRVLKSFVKTFWGNDLAAMITNPTFSTEETVKGDIYLGTPPYMSLPILDFSMNLKMAHDHLS